MSRPIGPGDVDDVFEYHTPTPEQQAAYYAMQIQFKSVVQGILLNCPESGDRDTALRHLRDARMWANASIALGGRY